jgi:tRNA threonylcarbamoyladenosine biosynthesis protein TsaB
MDIMTNVRMLALDTSTRSLTIAVLKDGQLEGEVHSIAERNHSLYLIPSIQTMLREKGLKPSDIDVIAVGIGPGSYTGVRIGVTVAKTIAWMLGVPVIGVSSLQALARGGMRQVVEEREGSQVRWFVPLMDARRKQAYAAVYKKGEAAADGADDDFALALSTLAGDGIRLMEQWLHVVADMVEELGEGQRKPDEIVFVGETEVMAEYVEAFTRKMEELGCRIRLDNRELEAYDIGMLGIPKLAAGEHSDVHDLVPNYTQLAEAEVKLLAKLGQGGEVKHERDR